MADYIYLGDRFTDIQFKNKECSAVRRKNDKCIRSRLGTMLVTFDGIIHNILARRLRKL